MKTLPAKILACQYVIISPVKDEERYVELTLRSVADQTLKPVAWILVDDGSKDRTPEIISSYAEAHSFIKLVRNPHTGARKPGSAVIRAFNIGYQALDNVEYDFIVKLDCDMSFDPDYFEKMIVRLFEEGNVGIASGVYLEMDKAGDWKEVAMPSYHAAGACKVVRRKCFEEIGGFIVSAGWDTVDEIRAAAGGWKTCHFSDLRMHHHKPEGSGIGLVRTSRMHGEIYYMTCGSKLFFLLKVLHRLTVRPYFVNALALIYGYVSAMAKRKKLLVTESEARYYKALLLGRLTAGKKFLLRSQ